MNYLVRQEPVHCAVCGHYRYMRAVREPDIPIAERCQTPARDDPTHWKDLDEFEFCRWCGQVWP